jgi:hypothetical protein
VVQVPLAVLLDPVPRALGAGADDEEVTVLVPVRGILVAPVFDEGEELAVTTRYGGWHRYDVRVESTSEVETRSLELATEELEGLLRSAS